MSAPLLRFVTTVGADPLQESTLQPLCAGLTDTLVPHGKSLFLGHTRTHLFAGLMQGHTGVLVGKNLPNLRPWLCLPRPQVGDLLLTVVAESRLLYSRAVVRGITDQLAIRLQARLTQQACQTLSQSLTLLVQEGLTNAVEHGSLGLHESRVDANGWNTAYYNRVHKKLATAAGAKPIGLYFTHDDTTLHCWIKDDGAGFDVTQIKPAPKSDFGSGFGLELCQKLARSLQHEDGGRCLYFTLPLPRARTASSGNTDVLAMRAASKILVVDDQPLNQDIICNYLENAGYHHFLRATSGMQALDMVLIHKPDLILLDLLMPQMDGFAVLEALKQLPEAASIPVLILSALNDTTNRTMGYTLGAVDFVNKPLEAMELVARTDTHLMNGLALRQQQVFSQKLTDELEEARHFQKTLFPTAAELAAYGAKHGLLIQYDDRPSERLGGDYWNVWSLGNTHLAFCMVDFSGHGTMAAFHTLQLHALMQELKHLATTPTSFILTLNSHLCRLLRTGTFATCVYGVMNTASGTVELMGCGAPPVLVLPAEQAAPVAQLHQAGVPLGLMADVQTESLAYQCVQLKPGEALLLYSDALSESLHTKGVRWGDEGVLAAVNALRTAGYTNTHMLPSLVRYFNKTAQMPLRDDLTLLSLLYQPKI